MKRYFPRCLFLNLLLIFVSVAMAQEVQIQMDNEGNVQVITADIERRLELFPTYSGFQEARLYQLADTSFVLEIIYTPHENTMKDRLPFSKQQVDDLRNRVSERLAAAYPEKSVNQEGRTKLLVGSLLLSLGYYSWAVPTSFDVQSSHTAGALGLLVSASGFFVPFLLSRDQTVTRGEASLCLYGASRGIGHGMLMNLLIEGDDQVTSQGLVASGLIASIGEGIAGYYIADRSKMSDGTACIVGVGGDFGAGIGAGAAFLADYSGDNQGQPIAGTILLGTTAGLWAGKMLANNQRYTRGDAYVVRASGLLGMYVPAALLGCARVSSGDAYVSVAMAGLMTGTAIGHYLIRDNDFSSAQGTVVTVGEFAGGLFGLGLAYLVTPNKNPSVTPYLALSSAGGIGGFWATYALFRHELQTEKETGSWNLDLVPKSYASLSTQRLFKPPAATVVPALQVEIKF